LCVTQKRNKKVTANRNVTKTQKGDPTMTQKTIEHLEHQIRELKYINLAILSHLKGGIDSAKAAVEETKIEYRNSIPKTEIPPFKL
jgi:hypothetical protein